MYCTNKYIQWVFALLCLVAILFLSFMDTGKSINPSGRIPYFDKIVHLFMYFGLYVVWSNLLGYRKITRLALMVFIVLLGAIVEYYQPILSSRSKDFFDGLFNAVGACCGFLLSNVLLKRKALLALKAQGVSHKKFA